MVKTLAKWQWQVSSRVPGDNSLSWSKNSPVKDLEKIWITNPGSRAAHAKEAEQVLYSRAVASLLLYRVSKSLQLLSPFVPSPKKLTNSILFWMFQLNTRRLWNRFNCSDSGWRLVSSIDFSTVRERERTPRFVKPPKFAKKKLLHSRILSRSTAGRFCGEYQPRC